MQQPEKRPGRLARGLAFVFVLFFIVALPLALFAFDLGQVVFNPPLVKRVITDEVVNSDLIPIALEWFSDRRAQQRVASGEARTGITEPDIVLLMSYLGRDDWKALKAEALTNEILAEWVSVTVDGFYAWIDSDDLIARITWNLKSLKDRVNGEHGVNSIKIAYSKLPPCTQPEIADFLGRQAAAPAGTEVLYNLCQFPAPWFEDQFSDYLNTLKNLVANVPDQFALTDELSRVADTLGLGPEALKQQLRLVRLLMQWAWIAPVVLLLLVLALAIRSVKALGRWWGIPIVVGGLLTLLPPLVYRGPISDFLIAGPLSEAPPLVRQEATRVFLRLAAEVFQPMLVQALVVLAVGLVLIVLMVVRRKRKPNP